MEEKYMVNDVLENSKNEIDNYTKAIIDAENMEFRQTLQTIRNSSESFQFELLTLANSKGYHKPNFTVKPEELNKLKSTLI